MKHYLSANLEDQYRYAPLPEFPIFPLVCAGRIAGMVDYNVGHRAGRRRLQRSTMPAFSPNLCLQSLPRPIIPASLHCHTVTDYLPSFSLQMLQRYPEQYGYFPYPSAGI